MRELEELLDRQRREMDALDRKIAWVERGWVVSMVVLVLSLSYALVH